MSPHANGHGRERESEGAQIAVNIVYNITDVNNPGLTVERPL